MPGLLKQLKEWTRGRRRSRRSTVTAVLVPELEPTPTSQPRKHIVFCAYPAWGHTKYLCSLAARFVHLQHITVTLLVTKPYLNQVIAETKEQLLCSADREYIRLIAIPTDSVSALELPAIYAAFTTSYNELVTSNSIRCAQSNTIYSGIPRPCAVLVDVMAYDLMISLRCIDASGPQVPKIPIFGWQPASVTATMRILGPEHMGGKGDMNDMIEKEMERMQTEMQIQMQAQKKEGPEEDGMELKSESAVVIDRLQAAKAVFQRCDGTVVRVPGLPPMYDWEFFPQDMPHAGYIGMLLRLGHRFLQECDGLFLNSSEAYEPAAIQAIRDWFTETGREHGVYVFSPPPPTSMQDGAKSSSGPESLSTTSALPSLKSESESSKANATDVETYMQSALMKHGERSLVYISFGTRFSTTQPAMLWAFFDAMIELQIPFIYADAPSTAPIPSDVLDKIKSSGLGFITPWAPQELILAHPVTGWFVSHCGQNSTLESLGAGIPLICWPFHVDQPDNAALLSSQTGLNVAYEMLSVRTGVYGVRPLYRDRERQLKRDVDGVRVSENENEDDDEIEVNGVTSNGDGDKTETNGSSTSSSNNPSSASSASHISSSSTSRSSSPPSPPPPSSSYPQDPLQAIHSEATHIFKSSQSSSGLTKRSNAQRIGELMRKEWYMADIDPCGDRDREGGDVEEDRNLNNVKTKTTNVKKGSCIREVERFFASV